MAPTHRVAVVQLYPKARKPLVPEHNYEKAERFIRSAAAQGALLAVLPEYHLTNWLPNVPRFRESCRESQKYLKEYQALARELRICIVPGTIVEVYVGGSDESSTSDTSLRNHISTSDRKDVKLPGLQNVAYFIDNNGDILARYVKKNLWGPTERNHLKVAGSSPHIAFDTPLGKVGLLICWDLAFPEAFRELVAQGAKTIIIPTFWTLSNQSDAGLKWNPTCEAMFVDSTIICRAFENTCAVIMANAGGRPGRLYQGGSQITVPFIGPIARMGSAAEGMAIADIDMQILEDAEENYQIRADLARDDWHYKQQNRKSKL